MRSLPVRRVYPLFVLSGACALVYEVAWVRLFTELFGSTVYAVTTVLAAFMAGLAAGSLLYGRWIDGKRRILVWYGLVELGIAVSAVGMTLLLRPLEPLTAALYRALHGTPPLLHGSSFLLAFLLLLVPTTLMGATFPIMSRFVVRSLAGMEGRLGLLYALNTLGAAAGTLAAGFWLIPTRGLMGSILLAAAGNVLIGFLMLWLGRREEPASAPEAEASPARLDSQERRVLWAFGLSGMAALGYEVVWTRGLTMILGSSTYAFSIMLATFLVGIALGGWLGGRIRGARDHRLLALALLQGGAAALGLTSCLILPRLPLVYLLLFPRFGYGGTFSGVIGLQALLAFLALITPTLVFGAVFPVATSLVADRMGSLGRRIGGAYAANTLGSILGSLAAGFLLVPLMGLRGTTMVLAGVNLLALAVLRPRPDRPRGRLGLVLVLVAVLSAGALAGLLPTDPSLLAAGVFDARRYVDRSGALKLDQALGANQLLYYREGASVTTAVFEDPAGERALYVNGKPVAGGSGADIKHLMMLGHLPMLLHPEPERVLVIGFGMGVTTGACALYGAEVTCVELSPEVLSAAPHFARENHHAWERREVRIVVGDGKRHVAALPDRFDVITADPIHPWVAGSGALYGMEHYRACQEHLAEGGIFCQWLPLYQLSSQDVRMILASFLEVFPQGSLWATEFDGILVGSHGPLRLDPARMAQVLALPTVQADLAQIGLDQALGVVGLLTADSRGLRGLAEGAPLNTDDHPLLEFTAPRSMYQYTPVENLAFLAGAARPPADRLPAPGIQWEGPDSSIPLEILFQAADQRLQGNLALGRLRLETAEAAYREALKLWPDYHEARSKLSVTLLRQAEGAIRQGSFEEALALCQECLQQDPHRAAGWLLLGRLQAARGQREAARTAWFQALALEPDNRLVQSALALH